MMIRWSELGGIFNGRASLLKQRDTAERCLKSAVRQREQAYRVNIQMRDRISLCLSEIDKALSAGDMLKAREELSHLREYTRVDFTRRWEDWGSTGLPVEFAEMAEPMDVERGV